MSDCLYETGKYSFIADFDLYREKMEEDGIKLDSGEAAIIHLMATLTKEGEEFHTDGMGLLLSETPIGENGFFERDGDTTLYCATAIRFNSLLEKGVIEGEPINDERSQFGELTEEEQRSTRLMRRGSRR